MALALAVGKPSWPTPTGNYKVYEKRKNPIWRVPASIQEEMEERGWEVQTKVLPGPKNPLGKYFIATTAWGVGIHATNRPWTVGYFVSHGCIRMLPHEIEQLFPQVQVGTPVKIIYRPIKLALTPQGRVYLEAIPNIYEWELNSMEWVKDMAEYYNIADRIDWDKVRPILKTRSGLAQDITKAGAPPIPAAPVTPNPPKEVRLSFAGPGVKVERLRRQRDKPGGARAASTPGPGLGGSTDARLRPHPRPGCRRPSPHLFSFINKGRHYDPIPVCADSFGNASGIRTFGVGSGPETTGQVRPRSRHPLQTGREAAG
jgi:hypothetical protein